MAKITIESNYWVTPNEILNSKELSLKAKWLYWLIQSKPEWWDFSANWLASQCSEWYESIQSWLRELEKVWLLERIKKHNEKWHRDMEYVLHSSINPLTENTLKGDMVTDNTLTWDRTNISKQDLSKQYLSKKEEVTLCDKNFSDFIELWNKQDKKRKLPQVRIATEQIKTARAKTAKLYTRDNIILWLDNYFWEIEKRNKDTDYSKHRFTAWEFLQRQGWLQKFINL